MPIYNAALNEISVLEENKLENKVDVHQIFADRLLNRDQDVRQSRNKSLGGNGCTTKNAYGTVINLSKIEDKKVDKAATIRPKSREKVATQVNPSRLLKPIEELRKSPKDFKELLKKNDAKMIK